VTVEELAGPPGELRGHGERRRAEHEWFASVELPACWAGNPTAQPVGPRRRGQGEIRGLGVSASRRGHSSYETRVSPPCVRPATFYTVPVRPVGPAVG